MKRFFPLAILTLAYLVSLAWLTVRENRSEYRSGYRVSTERSVSAEALAPEKKPLDLNTATAEELEQLRGIGPVLAQAIVEYRSAHGGFSSVEELLEISGIGEAKLEAIRGDVVIGGEGS